MGDTRSASVPATAGPPPRTHAPLRRRVGWLILVVMAAAGFGVVASRGPAPADATPTGDVARAAAAIEALLHERDAIPLLPKDFTTVTGVTPGYVPTPTGRLAAHINGGCSTPWGEDNTRWDYSPWCKAHDLGYDLLRYAEAKGTPLSAATRERLDDKLSRDMHAQCDRNPRASADMCRTVATLYSAGMVANSWHQRWGPPSAEPVATWLAGLLVVIALLAVRVPVRRRATARPRRAPRPPDDPPDERADYLTFLRMAALGGFVVAESVLAIAPLIDPAAAARLWPVTWLLHLVPLFFFTGGYANLRAWRAESGYGRYLAGRVCRLIRPVLAFVAAWLVVPLSLDLLHAPQAAGQAVGRLVIQPLWLLGLYLLVVSLTPAMHWLHRRAARTTVVVLAAATVTASLLGAAPVAGIVLALLFSQLAFHYADGTLTWPASMAVAALACLAIVTAIGGRSPLLMADPANLANVVPSATSVMLLGFAQVGLAALPGDRGVSRIARSGPARAVRFVRSAPMTVYLGYLCAVLMIAGILSAANLPTSAVDWLARPRSLFALLLVGVPAVLAFLLFEWRSALDPDANAARDRPSARRDAVAAAIGTGYGAAGILGFALTGLTGSHHAPVLLGVPLDPMSSVIHLLLGWYLLHSVRIGTTGTPWPWLLTAVACAPPLATATSAAGSVTSATLHGLTIMVTLVIACRRLAALPRRSAASLPVGGDPLATADSVP